MNIVLADHHPDPAILRAFAERGCPVRHVTGTADEAIWICRRESVDAVISAAVFLTGMNCVQLAEALRAFDPQPRLFIVSPFPARVLRNIPGFPPNAVPVFSIADVDSIVSAVAGPAASARRATL